MKNRENSHFTENESSALKISSKTTDEELIILIKNENEFALNVLVQRYADTVSVLSRTYFSEALTSEDWFQEGMLGLLFAVHTFKDDKNVHFNTYACACIKNSLNSAWRKANNKKNTPLNDSVELKDSALPNVKSPEDDYIQNEEYEFIRENYFNGFSELEKQVIRCYLSGLSYSQTANKLGITVKSVDNALHRAKDKIKKQINK